jgi:NDP-sugar pyrophosphorylase family protein
LLFLFFIASNNKLEYTTIMGIKLGKKQLYIHRNNPHNHLSELKDKKFGVDITYVKEDSPLGTAGALSLFKEQVNEPLLVSNGDLITDIRYSEMLEFHNTHKSFITVATRSHEWQNPYGVVLTSGSDVVGYEEKPLSKSNINAGVYVLDPGVLSLLEYNAHCDMPNLIAKALATGNRLYAYPMYENWLDVGRPVDLELANDRLERKG